MTRVTPTYKTPQQLTPAHIPTRRFTVIALTVVIAALAAFAYAVRDEDRTTTPSTVPTTSVEDTTLSFLPTKASDDPVFIPNPTHCPAFIPRTTPLNGPGWRILSDRTLCLNAEYPEGWLIHAFPTGISITEPTGHEGEYFATAFPGELTSEVHLRFSSAGDWASEPAGDFLRTNAIVYAQDTPMHAHIASYRVLLTDRTIVDMNAHAPENDSARQGVVLAILRSVELREVSATLRMSANVP